MFKRFFKENYLFIIYITIMILFTVFNITKRDIVEIIRLGRKMGFMNYNLSFNLHNSLLYYLNFKVLIFNVIFFIPLGWFALSYFNKKTKKINTIKAILFSLLVIILKEVSQFVLITGWFDVRDITVNFLGVLIGIFLYKFM